ncbi:hypothetical protein BK643_26100 [Pseudomonas protegens]|nr:hypothetical protein C1883_28460 [Pseudomonas protegens]ROM13057.1 hypothetical protein BK643_26100 [Pseudomonas protegens]
MVASVSEQKVKKSVSVRLDQDVLNEYQRLVEGAELSISDDMRLLVQNTIDKAEILGIEGKNVVACTFNWKKPPNAFPELVGHLLVTITPPENLPEQVLQRLVFVIPEFWTPRNDHRESYEHFRIDSAYFNRVTDEKHIKTSTRTTRNVMSFHLLKNKWFVSIFDYGTQYSKEEMQAEIEEKITQHIISTIKCYLIGHLPDSRIISEERHKKMISLYEDSDIDKMTKLF